MNKVTGKKNRLDAIDSLRGISIILVILLHIQIRIPFEKSSIGQFLPRDIIKGIFWNGNYGVTIFFVISGFLITSSSLNRWGSIAEVGLAQFYKIRFARIVPCLIALIIVLSFLDLAGINGFRINSQHTSLGRAILSAITFHLNWLEAKTGYLPASWDVLWSLSVEEAFYLVFPLGCRILKSERNFTLYALVFVLLGPFSRTIFSSNEMWQEHSYLSCMDGIALGCMTALFTRKVKIESKWKMRIWIFGLMLTLFIMVFKGFTNQIGLNSLGLNVTLLEVGVALLIIGLSEQSEAASWPMIPLRWFGRNSYEIYLTHSFIVLFAVQIFNNMHFSNKSIVALYVAILSLSGVLGHFVARYYSEPLNQFLCRWRRQGFSEPITNFTKI